MQSIGWYRVWLTAACASGLALGFALGMSSPWSNSSQTVAVNKVIALGRSSYEPVILDSGWGKREAWGVAMQKPEANVTLGFDGPAAGDVELLTEARLQGGEDALIAVRYNDIELGSWLMSPKWRLWRRRFIIPKHVFNRRMDGILSFEVQKGRAGQFGIEGIVMRDATGLGVHKGFLDRCTPDVLTGWAVGNDTPINVFATLDGDVLPAAFVSVHRPDLEALGLPPDAGFELKLEKPLPLGSRVEVRFANGRHLSGSPCQL